MQRENWEFETHRGQIVLEFAEAALQEFEEQRRSVVEPLNQLERTALSDLRATYAQLVEAQAAVTAHLSSLREAEVQQDALLERFGLRETRDRILDDAIGINEKIMGLIDRGGNAADTLKAISKTIGTGSVKLAFVERAGTRDRDLNSSQAAIVTASQMRKERPRSSR